MKLQLKPDRKREGCADGAYYIKAAGCILAALSWGNDSGPLDNWSPFAYVPIDPYGNGSFHFTGGRAIPPMATHIYARCVTADLQGVQEALEVIPEKFFRRDMANISQDVSETSIDDANADVSEAEVDAERTGVSGDTTAGEDDNTSDTVNFSVMSDLHLYSKPNRVKRAFELAKSSNILLIGDLTTDGLPEQYLRFEESMAEVADNKLILAVPGNHDMPLDADEEKFSQGYCNFWEKMKERLFQRGFAESFEVGSDGAYALQFEGLDIIGLQCVVAGRKFLFPKGRALKWLDEHLSSHTDVKWHMILCHAPLIAHNPQRTSGAPYLDKNKELQSIVDRHGNIIFLSGHTHVSPNVLKGCVDWNIGRRNIYINCGSVVPTDIAKDKVLSPPEWKDGILTELSVSENSVEILMKSAVRGINYPRGYYRIDLR